jgi:hypothetical protein
MWRKSTRWGAMYFLCPRVTRGGRVNLHTLARVRALLLFRLGDDDALPRDAPQLWESAAMMGPKSSAVRLAPPTSAPSTSGSAKISAAFPGFTEPP